LDDVACDLLWEVYNTPATTLAGLIALLTLFIEPALA
jgi:hypothetical protein